MHMVDHLPLIADSTPPTAVLTLLSPKTLTAYSLFKFRMLCIQLNSRLTMFCDPCLTSFTKRAELTSLQTAALYTFLEVNGFPQNICRPHL